MSRPLDRSRPLWEMYVVEGLENGHIATVTKTHHAAIDGVSGAELTVNLLDLQPEPAPVPEQRRPGRPTRSRPTSSSSATRCSSLARQPLLGFKAVRRTVGTVLNTRRRNRQPDVTPPPGFFSAPRTSLNVSISPRRRFAFTEVTLDDIKMVKNALGGTVNDVVLAMCSGALRAYFAERGEQLDGPLQAMVPISVRTEDQKGAMGNQVSSMLVSLASDVDDPVERLHTITEGTKGAKEQEKAIGADTLTATGPSSPRPRWPPAPPGWPRRSRSLERVRPPVQRHHLQRPRAAVPAVLGRRPHGGHVPDGPGHGRRRPQHHGDELHGHDVLRPDGRPRGRARRVGHRPPHRHRPGRAQEGGRRGHPPRPQA